MLPPELAIDLDLEPLEPFLDDVFAGMDEHPAGPWAHHTRGAGQPHQQAQDTHFPAIDCNLVEQQPYAEPAADLAVHQQGSSFIRHPEAHLSTVTADVRDGEAPRPVEGWDVTALLQAAELYDMQACPASSSMAAPEVQGLHASCHAEDAAQRHAAGMASSSCSVEHNQPQHIKHDDSHHQQQQQEEEGQQEEVVAGTHTLQEGQAVPADALTGPAPGQSHAGAGSSSEAHGSGASSSSSEEAVAACTADVSSAAQAIGVPACDAQAAGSRVENGGLGGASADDAPAAAACSTAGRSDSSGDDAGPGAGGSTAADVVPEDAADSLAAAAGPEPSSGSLPDIDDVPEQEDSQQQQQQPQWGVHTVGPVAVVAHQQQEEGVGLSAYRLGTAAQQPALGDSTQQMLHPDSAAAADQQAGPDAGQQQDPACSKDSSHFPAALGTAAADSGGQAAQETVALVAADAAVSDCHAALAHGQQQLPAPYPDDFGSPCSSWHSCMTAASKASSMNSSWGFFLQPPVAAVSAGVAAAAAAALAATSNRQGGTSRESVLSAQQQQPSRSGVSSPAMVSSLHLALQQQQRSQHSDQLAASVTLQDPLSAGGAGSVSSLAAGIAELDPSTAATAAADAAADAAEAAACDSEGDSSDDKGEGSSSQPIAVQCAHEHYQRQQQERREEDPWQSVSPPSFTSSPGLLVSAVAARAAAQDAIAAAGTTVAVQADDASGGRATAAATEGQHQDEEGAAAADAEDDDIGHGCFYADSAGLSMSPEQGGLMYPPGRHHPAHQHMAASSYILRQSELVDLSLSASMHPSQLQLMQQQSPGWLTAHQQLPPAAAQAVERAVVALNDSYCYPGRGGQSPSEVFGSAAAAPTGGAAGARAMGVAAMGAVGGAIRRSGAGVQWNRAHTQPQQDQQARHRLPSPNSGAGPAGTFGWPGAAVLGDWFSSTVQQPLAAVASRAAVGVGQRLGMAPGQQHHAAAFARQHSIKTPPTQAGAHCTGAAVRSVSPGGMGEDSPAEAAPAPARMAPAGKVSTTGDGCSGPACLAAEDSLDDAVMIEKTSDLPQSLQEQEDEAFRGLLFMGGRDSQGRPVVIVNTDAIPAGHNSAPRDAALAFLLKRLSPVVTKGPYVLVIVALHHGPQFRLLPGVWCLRAYQSLPRVFRKHVKHVILLQPSMLVKAAVTLLYPFVSSKAHAKVKQVQRLLDIDAATRGEVQVPHLGEAFLTTIHHINNSRAREAGSSSA